MAPDSADVVSAIGLYAPARELEDPGVQAGACARSQSRQELSPFGLAVQRTPRKQSAWSGRPWSLIPSTQTGTTTLAGTLYHQGRDEEAFAELRRSIELEPELVFNHYRMGFWAAYDLGRLDEGLIHLRKAYALDPQHGYLIFHFSAIYAALGAWEEAQALLEQGMEQSPGEVLIWYGAYQFEYYKVYASMVEKDKALKYLRQAVDMEPDDSWSLHALGLLDIREGNAEVALERWRHAYPVLTTSDHPEIDENNLMRGNVLRRKPDGGGRNPAGGIFVTAVPGRPAQMAK